METEVFFHVCVHAHVHALMQVHVCTCICVPIEVLEGNFRYDSPADTRFLFYFDTRGLIVWSLQSRLGGLV